jgi:peroxiredoxin
MVANICLLTCALAAGQSTGRADWLLLPQFARGQELVYRGTFTERSLSPNVQFERTYGLETSLFVMEQMPKRWQVAILTTLRLKNGRGDDSAPSHSVPSSVRLELVEVGPQGQVVPGAGVNLAVPLEGPPTLEAGAIVEVPSTRVRSETSWLASEAGRPARTWRVAGTEVVCSTLCVKLVGEQQSPDWDRPRADSTGWWRRDTVWVAPQLGIAYRVEREIKRRDPARAQPTYQSVTRYEREKRLTFTGKLFDERCKEAQQACRFAGEAGPLLGQPELYRDQLDALLRKIAFHLDNHLETPYRQAVLQTQHRVEAARRGERVPAKGGEPAVPTFQAARGQQAPDFVVSDLVGKHSLRLYRYLGKPVLLVFYNPATDAGRKILDFSRAVAGKNKAMTILALVMTEDEELARQQHAELHLPFPVADGRGLRVAFAVTDTPRMVLLDADGIVRGAYTGWGTQTTGDVQNDLSRLLAQGRDK